VIEVPAINRAALILGIDLRSGDQITSSSEMSPLGGRRSGSQKAAAACGAIFAATTYPVPTVASERSSVTFFKPSQNSQFLLCRLTVDAQLFLPTEGFTSWLTTIIQRQQRQLFARVLSGLSVAFLEGKGSGEGVIVGGGASLSLPFPLTL